MRSRLPKVLQPLSGRPILGHILHALRQAGLRETVVVTGHAEDEVRASATAACPEGMALRFAHQSQPLGTGHAVQQARDQVTTASVLIVNGDLGLLRADQVRAIATAEGTAAGQGPLRDHGAITVATAEVPDPTGLGRIVRTDVGLIDAIVEEALVDDATRGIKEINVGLYRFDSAWLWSALDTLPASDTGEIYLGDVLANAMAEGLATVPVPVDLRDGLLNIENKRDLARAEQVIRRRIVERQLDSGVTITDPATTYIDADVCIGADAVIEPGCHLRGKTSVGAESRLGPNAVISDTHIGARCELVGCTITGSVLGDGVEVGPYTTVRSGTVLDDGVHLGTHVETKNAHLQQGVKVGHFSYVGDAEVGARTNIGAGAITCNFDGESKHRTVIGADVFIGSDSLLIAPLSIGDGARTGAGSVVNKDVPAGGSVVGSPARAIRAKRPVEPPDQAGGDA
jgi:bifunctional UDP-N-acetylglucosamine pyrophosphorylase/glucosamine-1-phosphate N-acetyltransferase